MTGQRPRTVLALAGVGIVGLGLTARFGLPRLGASWDFVADLAGSVLYTTMWFVLLRFVFLALSARAATAWAVGISVGIELLQLTGLPALAVSAFAPLRLLLGTTFAVLDLVGYALGGLVALGVAKALERRGSRPRSAAGRARRRAQESGSQPSGPSQ